MEGPGARRGSAKDPAWGPGLSGGAGGQSPVSSISLFSQASGPLPTRGREREGCGEDRPGEKRGSGRRARRAVVPSGRRRALIRLGLHGGASPFPLRREPFTSEEAPLLLPCWKRPEPLGRPDRSSSEKAAPSKGEGQLGRRRRVRNGLSVQRLNRPGCRASSCAAEGSILATGCKRKLSQR